MKYLAYFQAYTNTYASLEELRRMYEEALQVEDIVGIVIGTASRLRERGVAGLLGRG